MEAVAPEKTIKRGRGGTLKVAFMVAALLFMGRFLAKSWAQLPQISFSSAAPTLLGGLIVATALRTYWAFLWSGVINALGAHLPIGSAMRAHTRTLLARYIPGNVWHAVSLSHWCQQEGVPTRAVVTSWVLDNIYPLVGTIVPALLTAPWWLAGGMSARLPALGTALLLGVVFAHPRVLAPLLSLPLRLLRKSAVEIPFSFGQSLLYAILYGTYAVGHGLLLWGLITAFGGAGHLTPPAAVGIYCASWAIGFLSIVTPSGLGVREGIMIVMLERFVPHGSAVLVPIVLRLLMTLSEVVAALLPFGGRERFTPGGRPDATSTPGGCPETTTTP